MRTAERLALAQPPESARFSVFTLQSHEITLNWHWIDQFLARFDSPGWKNADVRADLEKAQAQLWGFHQDGEPFGIWITRIETTPNGKRGLLWIAAGEPLDQGLALFREHTESWLREKGCTFVEIVGRRGWGRVLKDYREVGTVFVKELTDGQ